MMLWILFRRAAEVLLMSTHKICFCGEIRKILIRLDCNNNTFGLEKKKKKHQEL